MPTNYRSGQRIVHKTLGPGTVTEAEGDSVRVELDAEPGRIRTFMASLGTIAPETQASGAAQCASSTASAGAADPPTTSLPPAAAEVKREPQPRPRQRAGMAASEADRENPSQVAPAAIPENPTSASTPRKTQAYSPIATPGETPMSDALLTRLNETLAARGRGSAQALGVHIKRHPTCIATWRNTGAIPASIRDAVTEWIEKPVFTAVRVEKTKPAPKAKPAPKLRLVEKTTDPPPPIRCAVDAGKILAAMGLTITTAWIQEDGIMRAKAVAVLP